jgi:hypothetical protein
MRDYGVFQILEWHDKRYQPFKKVTGSRQAAEREVKRLNKGYSGPRYVLREA